MSEIHRLLTFQHSDISLRQGLCKDFIPFIGVLQKLNIFPPLTALRNAERRFQQYGELILRENVKKGEMDDPDAKKTNVGVSHTTTVQQSQLLNGVSISTAASRVVSRS